MNYIEKLKKWSPEYITVRIYNNLFTPIRVQTFWLIVIFCFVDIFWLRLDITSWFPFFDQEIFISITKKMIYLLLPIGAFTATFFTIVIEIIKNKLEAQNVTVIWSNLIKYTVYPFIVAVFIGVALFLRDIGIYNHMPLSIFLLFTYLTINSFYTTIKMAEILVNETWQPEPK